MAVEDNIVKTETSPTDEIDIKFTKVEKKSGKRIGYNYIILKSLKQSQKNDVIKCLYIKSLLKFGICVIKEGTYGDSKDIHGRDIKDRLLWQKELHQLLQNKIPVPRLLGSFEENGNYYLVIERIKGKPLASFIKERKRTLKNDLIRGSKVGIKCLEYLEQISNILSKLHEQKIIHRDVSANNFIITPNDKIAIIDLELSYSLDRQYPSPPFLLGTRGYMSPEQESASLFPTKSEDVYSLGIIVLQAWSGISALKLNSIRFEDIIRKVPFFIQDLGISDIITQCLHPDPTHRPTAVDVEKCISSYRKALILGIPRQRSLSPLYSTEEIHDTIKKGINSLGTSMFCDREKGWFAENLHKRSSGDKLEKSWYGSFSQGVAGIIYFLALAHKTGYEVSNTRDAIELGWNLIREKYMVNLEKSSPGLYNGSDGVALTLATAIKHQLLVNKPEYIEWIRALLERNAVPLNLSDGLAGQGIANLHCRHILPDFTAQRLEQIVEKLISEQHESGSWIYRDRMTKGYNSGAAGIIKFLLDYGKFFDNRHALQSAEKGLHWLIAQARKENDNYYWVNSKGDKLDFIFCEGGIGIGMVLLKGYEILNNPAFKNFAMGALGAHSASDVQQDKLGQCHGLAGEGEVYLEAYRILKEDYWLERASKAVQLIMNLKKVNPKHGLFWLVENEKQPVANFMRGNSGVLHFLMRYIKQPQLDVPLSTD